MLTFLNRNQLILAALLLAPVCSLKADLGTGQLDPGFAERPVNTPSDVTPIGYKNGKSIRVGFSYRNSFDSIIAPSVYHVADKKIASFLPKDAYDCLEQQLKVVEGAMTKSPAKPFMKSIHLINVVVEYVAEKAIANCNPFNVVVSNAWLLRPCFVDPASQTDDSPIRCDLVTESMIRRQFNIYQHTFDHKKQIHDNLKQTTQEILKKWTE